MEKNVIFFTTHIDRGKLEILKKSFEVQNFIRLGGME